MALLSWLLVSPDSPVESSSRLFFELQCGMGEVFWIRVNIISGNFLHPGSLQRSVYSRVFASRLSIGHFT